MKVKNLDFPANYLNFKKVIINKNFLKILYAYLLHYKKGQDLYWNTQKHGIPNKQVINAYWIK